MHELPQEAELSSFEALDVRAGTILAARKHEKARKPAYILDIDFGPLGLRTSTAQITDRYRAERLVGRQVIAIVNLPPRRVAGIESQVLVLGALTESGVVLLQPQSAVPNGSRIA